MAGVDQVAEDGEPHDGAHQHGHVEATGGQLDAEQRRAGDADQPAESAGLLREDRQQVRDQQDQEERHHGEGPAAKPQAGDAGCEPDDQGAERPHRDAEEQVVVAAGREVARRVGAGGVHGDLAESQLAGVAEAEVQPAHRQAEDGDQDDLAGPERPSAHPRVGHGEPGEDQGEDHPGRPAPGGPQRPHQTSRSARSPSKPVGRSINTNRRRANTIRSWYAPPM